MIIKIQFEIVKYKCGKEMPYRFMLWDQEGCYNEWYFIHNTPFENGDMPDYWDAERISPKYIVKNVSWRDSQTTHYLNDVERNSVQYQNIKDKNYLCYAGINKGRVE